MNKNSKPQTTFGFTKKKTTIWNVGNSELISLMLAMIVF